MKASGTLAAEDGVCGYQVTCKIQHCALYPLPPHQTGFLCVALGILTASSVDQVSLELTCLCLKSAGIKGMRHHCLAL